jgi:hypothetical protein
MSVGTFPKQPTETYTVGVDFADKLPTGASVSTGTVTAIDPAGVDVSGTVLSDTSVTVSGTKALIRVLAGVHGLAYRLKFVCTLSNGDVREKDLLMSVENQ